MAEQQRSVVVVTGASGGVGFADCLLAGTCLRYDLPFATRNRKHFDRVDGLRLIDVDQDPREA